MKKRNFLLVGLLLFSVLSVQAQKKSKTFEGIVTYDIIFSGNPEIEESMNMLPDFMRVATYKVRDDKGVFNIMGNKVFVDVATNRVVSQVDLSMLGLGVFCIEIPHNQMEKMEEVTYKEIGETKKILDYEAKKIRLDNGLEFLVASDVQMPFGFMQYFDMKMLPLEFEIGPEMMGGGDMAGAGVNIRLVAVHVSTETPKREEVEMDKDCKMKTLGEFQELMKEITKGMYTEDDEFDIEEE